jgi:hypothetical protein
MLGRGAGALTVLPIALTAIIAAHTFADELSAAAQLIDEVRDGYRCDRERAPAVRAVIVVG